MTGPALYDAGLQPERTRLAWRRTLLALAAGALVALRLLPPVLGVRGLVIALTGVLATVLLGHGAARRVRRTRTALLSGRGPLPGGALLLAVALVVAASAVLGLVVVVVVVVEVG